MPRNKATNDAMKHDSLLMALGGRPNCDAEVARLKNSIDRAPTNELNFREAYKERGAGGERA